MGKTKDIKQKLKPEAGLRNTPKTTAAKASIHHVPNRDILKKLIQRHIKEDVSLVEPYIEKIMRSAGVLPFGIRLYLREEPSYVEVYGREEKPIRLFYTKPVGGK